MRTRSAKSDVNFWFMSIVIVTVALLSGCSKSDEQSESMQLKELMPDSIGGWRADTTETYNRETIFDYMDGAGEVYRMYDYRELAVRKFSNPGKPGIVAEVFDMGSPEDAYGIFSHSRETEEPVPGQGAEYRTGMMIFWKNRYFVSTVTEKETPETKEAIYELAAAIDMRIKSKGTKPELLKCLPEENLSPSSVRFFHLYTSLNYHYYLSDQNILMLSDKTDAVLGVYQPDATYLVCIRYPDSEQAKQAYANFIKSYIPEAVNGAAETENGKWVVSELQDRYIILAFDALNEPDGRELIEKAKERLPER